MYNYIHGPGPKSEDEKRRESMTRTPCADPAVKLWGASEEMARKVADTKIIKIELSHHKPKALFYYPPNPRHQNNILFGPVFDTPSKRLAAITRATAKTASSRYALNAVNIELSRISATDGHRLWIQTITTGISPGLHIIDKNGQSIGVAEGGFPDIASVMPDTSGPPTLILKAYSTWRNAHKAAIMTSDDNKVVSVHFNPDGSLGFTAKLPEVGEAKVNLQSDAKEMFRINPHLLIDALEWHARNGDPIVSLWFTKANKPITIKGRHGQTLSVTMPIDPN